MKKRFILLAQMIPVLLLLLFISQIILEKNEYSLICFNNIGPGVALTIFILLCIYEFLFIIVYSFISKRYLLLIIDSYLLFPLILLTSVMAIFDSYHDYHEVEIEELDVNLSIASHGDGYMGGESYVYQKECFFLARYVETVSDGDCVLEKRNLYTITVEDNIIIIAYSDDLDLYLYLKYNEDTGKIDTID